MLPQVQIERMALRFDFQFITYADATKGITPTQRIMKPHRNLCLPILSLPLAFAWLFFLSGAPTRAQEYLRHLNPTKAITQFNHDVWRSADGLPQNSVNTILQTRDGYLWIGTQEGLLRFDGNRFTTFDKGNVAAFRSNYIWSLFEDSRGTLWAGTNGGGIIAKTKSGFVSYTTKEGLAGNIVRAICEDPSGGVWFGTNTGASRFYNGKWTTFTTANGLPSNDVSMLYADKNSDVWISGSGGVVIARYGSIINPTPNVQSIGFSVMLRDRQGTLWLGHAERGLYRWSKGAFVPDTAASRVLHSGVLSLFEDQAGSLWIGTAGSGLVRKRGQQLSSFTTEHGLSDDYVKSLLQDAEGNLWIGTYSGGLNRLRDGKFTSITTRERISSDFVLSVSEDKAGSVWLGTYGDGLNQIHPNGQVTIYRGDGIMPDVISSVYAARDGSVWIGSYGKGVLHFDGESIDIYTKKKGLGNEIIVAQFESRDGAVWFGTMNGLSVFRNGKMEAVPLNAELDKTSIQCIAQSPDGTMWFGTAGLGLVEWRDGIAKIHSTKTGLTSDLITALFFDSNGELWIGTDGGGLNRLTKKGVRSYGMAQGLYNDVVFAILEDSHHHLWMSCNKGIYCIERKSFDEYDAKKIQRLTCMGFGEADGMTSSECNGRRQPAAWKGADGSLWFATIEGVTRVNPERLPINARVPPVAIERVYLDGREIPAADSIIVPAGTTRVEIQFTALSFVAPERVRFKYQLADVDERWVDQSIERHAVYTHLQPGAHLFKVIACNNDGVWNETGATILLIVKPRFYQTTLFYIVAAFALLALLFVLYWLRMRRVRAFERELVSLVRQRTQKLEEEKERTEEALREKSDLINFATHDLKNPLQTILGFSQLVHSDQAATAEIKRISAMMYRAAAQMLTIINELLEIAALESGKLRLNKILLDAGELCRTIVANNEQLAKRKEQSITLQCEENLLIDADADRLREAIENLLSNAIKYSPRGKTISLFARRDEESIRISVRDEGPGIDEAERGKLFGKFQKLSSQPTGGESSTGLGLAIVHTIVAMHGGTVGVESEVGSGSTFTIELPLERSDDETPTDADDTSQNNDSYKSDTPNGENDVP